MSKTVTVPNAKKSVRKTGSRRTDNIRKRGSSWQVRFVHNGIKESRTFATKDEGLLWLDLKRGEQLEGDLGKFHLAQRHTLRSAILCYRDHLLNVPGEDQYRASQ
jgi:hypothetical protein